MKILIVEDEPAAAERLSKLLQKTLLHIDILGVTDSISTTVEWLQQNNAPDLVMMDIHLADGSAFEIFELTEVKSPVIFTTAYDNYAIKAFKVNSIDYLLKPIKEEELAYSLNKLEKIKATNISIEELLKSIKAQHSTVYRQRFLVHFAQKLKAIDVSEISYFEAHAKNVFLATSNGAKYTTDHTIEKLEAMLNPLNFFRINRRLIVNFNSIGEMFSHSKSRIKLKLSPIPETEAIVSTERSADFKNWLNR